MTQSGPPQDQTPAPGGQPPSWQQSLTSTTAVPGPAGLFYADVPNRIIAYIIDIILLAVIGFVVTLVLGGLFGGITSARAIDSAGGDLNFGAFAAVTIAQLAISFAYFGYFWSVQRGTPGMKLLGLQIGDETDGHSISWNQALIRWLVLGIPSILATFNSVQQILDRVPEKWTDKIKPELMQSYCEINTDICESIKQVETDLSEKLKWAQTITNELGLQFVWCGLHPFSPWQEQKYSQGKRYAWLTKSMRDVSHRAVVFGLHVHVGVDSGDKAIQLCDRLLRHIPTLLALSANSPMFNGRDTGLASYRSNILDSLPTAGLPVHMRNWSEYVWLVDHLCSTGFIKSIREIWWDVRPHHEFGTVEIRIMDMPLNMKHLLGLVSLTQCLVAAISQQIDQGAYLYDCHPMIAKQNKWHASRYGLDAMFVDPDTMQAVPARQTAHRLMQRCIPFAQKLDCLEELMGLNDLLDNGTGARLQREIFDKTQDMREVVKFLINQSQAMG